MKKWLLFVGLLLLFLVGCEENVVHEQTNNEEESEELTNLQTQLDDLQKQIDELQQSTEYQNNQNKETNDNLILLNDQVQHFINHLPEIESKLGYIEQINSSNSEVTLRVQLVDMLEDSSMPNGYSINELDVETITLSNDFLIYVLDGVSPVVIKTIEQLDEKIKEHQRLLKFSLVNGKVILINQIYLP